MNTSSNQQFIALGILLFSAIAVILGIIQLAKNQADMKTAGIEEPSGGAFLSESGSRLASIKLDGIIVEEMDNDSLFDFESSAVKARKQLYQAAKDNSIKGVLLRINSPGGTVAMSQELYQAVETVSKQKPVVVSMGDLAASGGYYTAAAADRIVANPGTLTASIGVILQVLNMEGLLTDKLGIKAVTIKSGQFKDMLSPYRQTSDADRKLAQGIIDKSYRQFLNAVIVGRTRDMTDAQAKAQRIQSITSVADGRVVLGEDALKAGLIDQLGDMEDAKKLLQTLAGKRFKIARPEKLTLQEYESQFSLWQFLGFGSSDSESSYKRILSVNTAGHNPFPQSWRFANQPLWLMEGFQ